MKFPIYLIICLSLYNCAAHNQALLSKKKPALYSYIIGNVKNNHIIAESNSEAFITPASCQKTITALISYNALGPESQFRTELYSIPKANGKNDLLISFSGDPLLTSFDIAELLSHIKNKNFSGQIILDASSFNTSPHSPNIMRDDIGTFYAQPVYSINIDKNLININVELNKKGKPIIKNDASFATYSKINIDNSKPSNIKLKWGNNIIKASGTFNSKDQKLEFQISPPEIKSYIINKMKGILKTLSINAKIIIVSDKAEIPKHKTLINYVLSKPLKSIIPDALKTSDNLVFDSLYLQILHQYSKTPVEKWEEGDAIFKNLIKQYLDIDMNGALIVDGSGLSRYNRIQTKKLFELLKASYVNKNFLEALPQVGEINTTLEERIDLPSSIKAKTGAMSGVSCLCGYNIKEKDIKVFAFIANNFAPPLKEMYKVQDNFLKYYLK